MTVTDGQLVGAGERRIAPALKAIAYSGALFLTLLPFLIYPVPALVDYLNHLARMHVLATIDDSPALQANYVVEWRIFPYLAMDAVVPLLAKFMSLYLAGRVFVMLAIAAMFLGVCALRRVVHGEVGYWPLLALPLMLSGPLAWGFVNFVFGVGASLLLLALWLHLRARANVAITIIFNALTALLFLMHLFAFASYALIVALIAIGSFLRESNPGLGDRMRRLLIAAAQFAVPIVLWFLSLREIAFGFTWFGSITSKIASALWTVIFTGTPIDFTLPILLCGLLALGPRRPNLQRPLKAPVIILAALSPFIPVWLNGVWLGDIRLPLVVMLLAVAAIRPRLSRRVASVLFATASIFFLARTGVILLQWREYNHVLSETEVVLEEMRRGASVLPVQSETSVSVISRGLDDLPNQYYWHLAAAAVISRDAFMPYLFSGATTVRPRSHRTSISANYSVPLTPEDLRSMVQGSAEHSYGQAWPERFDYVLWVHRGKPVGIECLPLELVAEGNYVNLYAIAPQRSCLNSGQPP